MAVRVGGIGGGVNGGDGDAPSQSNGFDGGGGGADGGFGGGGGGGDTNVGHGENGGAGGFGGGGGGGGGYFNSGPTAGAGGAGGFGGGGGGGGLARGTAGRPGGDGGFAAGAGGAGSDPGGGGGAGLGGGIFSKAGTLTLTGDTFTSNTAAGGSGAEGTLNSGSGLGGALFALNSLLTASSNTFSGNSGTSSIPNTGFYQYNPVAQFLLSVSNTSLTAGNTTSVTITAEDQYGEVAVNFSDSIELLDSLGGASYSAVTFTGGVATVTATLDSAGSQSITATDPTAAVSGTSGPITVSPAAFGRVAVSVALAAPVAGSEFQVNTYTTGNQQSPKVASDTAGDYVVVWQSFGEGSSDWDIYAQRYNASGAAQGSELEVNTYTSGNQFAPTVAMDSQGDFVVAWQGVGNNGSNYGIYARLYNASGVALEASQFLVNTFTGNNQSAPAAAMDSEGDFVVAWHGAGGVGAYGIYARQYNASGTPQASPFQVSAGVSNPAVAMDSQGDFIITSSEFNESSSDYNSYAQEYQPSGAPEGGKIPVFIATGVPWNPSVAMDPQGDFVITANEFNAYSSDYNVYAQEYQASGIPEDGEITVVSSNVTLGNSSVAIDPAGDFVIAWRDGYGSGIYAQRYAAGGTAQGGALQVNNTANNQSAPSVALDSTGDFVVAWQSPGQDGSDYGVYAERYATPTSFPAGSTTSVFITAEDPYGNVITNFSDSVTLSDSLAGASFSPNPVVSFTGGSATVAATFDKAVRANHHGQ